MVEEKKIHSPTAKKTFCDEPIRFDPFSSFLLLLHMISIGRQQIKNLLKPKKTNISKKRLYTTEGIAATIQKYGDPQNVIKYVYSLTH